MWYTAAAVDAPKQRSWWARDHLAASLLLAALAGLLYGSGLCPTVSWYDSAEFSATAATLRVVPHPPGYPLYSVLGHVFTWIPGEAAWGMNVMSAVFGVLAVVMLHRVCLALEMGGWGSASAGLMLAVAPSFWGNAVKAEVYTPGIAWMLGVVWLCLLARGRHDVRWAWAAALVAGLGLGVHMSLATFGLGYVGLLVSGWWASGHRMATMADRKIWAKLCLGCLVAAALGSTVFLLIPFGPFETVTPLGPYPNTFARMWRRFSADVGGGVFRGYFKALPFSARALEVGGIFGENLGVAGSVLAVLGALGGWFRRRAVTGSLLLGIAGNVWFFFRYDVPDLDVFLLPSVVATAVFVGFAVEEAGHRWRPGRGIVAAAVVAQVAWTAQSRAAQLDLSQDRTARIYGEAACAEVEPGSILAMTSTPAEWKLSSVLLYMHESGEGCHGVEFWGMANMTMVHAALREGRTVYAYVEDPRFAPAFKIYPKGPLFEVRRRPH